MPCTGRWNLSPPQPWARLRMLFHLPARLNRRLICFPLGLTLSLIARPTVGTAAKAARAEARLRADMIAAIVARVAKSGFNRYPGRENRPVSRSGTSPRYF
jgi:hypothetical protein